MSIRFYNSLTKKKEELRPQKGKTIKMYSCGVTVYDHCHIGHARSLYVFDVIRRYLRFRGYDVHFVRNITDVDDKIINKAKELNKPWQEIVAENIDSYRKDLKDLGMAEADIEPRATENIPGMIKHIEGLVDKGMAYEVEGDVYFQVRQFTDYGKLSGQSVDKMMEAVRIEKDDKKMDPLDFALWKRSQPGEPYWDSPWGEGRPGWHIECSCMSLTHLDCETIDIHAGGRDLIFPHHENEIAQAEALSGKPFALHWIHHGLLTINGQKMAKSLGNFVTIQDALKKFSADDLKFFFLSSHYASAIDYSEEKMQEAHKALQRLVIFLNRANKLAGNLQLPGINLDDDRRIDFLEKRKEAFEKAMDDDFNTPAALGVLFDLVNETNAFIDNEQNDVRYVTVIHKVSEEIITLFKNIFGFDPTYWEPFTSEEKQLLKEREKARANKDFKRSDELRDILKGKGIIVEDTKDGQSRRRA